MRPSIPSWDGRPFYSVIGRGISELPCTAGLSALNLSGRFRPSTDIRVCGKRPFNDARLTRRPSSILLPEFISNEATQYILVANRYVDTGKACLNLFSNPHPERRSPHGNTFVRTAILFFSSDSRRPVILVNKKNFYANLRFPQSSQNQNWRQFYDQAH